MKANIQKEYCLGYQVDKLQGTQVILDFNNFTGNVSLKLKKDEETGLVTLCLDVKGSEIDYV